MTKIDIKLHTHAYTNMYMYAYMFIIPMDSCPDLFLSCDGKRVLIYFRLLCNFES